MATRALRFFFCLFVASCGDPDPESCFPGATQACIGAGGCSGGQMCNEDGMGFDPCVCGAMPMDSSVDGGLADAQTPMSDAGAVDASADATVPTEELRAFPGAEGFGKFTEGGRGGRVIKVTNLNDSGPGSLREAVEAEGPRIVVFEVGGTILLSSSLAIRNPHLTIAGQTAPGDGIALRHDLSSGYSLVVITADEVILRHLRLRTGGIAPNSNRVDNLQILAGNNIIVDHCSISWGTDENVSIVDYDEETNTTNITIQDSIVAEGLGNSASRGILISGDATRTTLYRNYFVHNYQRNPRIHCELCPQDAEHEVVNNLFFNWGKFPASLGAPFDAPPPGVIYVNMLNNHWKNGPSTSFRRPIQMALPARVFVDGNIGPFRLDLETPETELVSLGGAADAPLAPASFFLDAARPTPLAGVELVAALDLEGELLADVGASLPRRDAADARVIADIADDIGRIPVTPEQVVFPDLQSGDVPLDTDGDGMPDAWEDEAGLDSSDPSDGAGDLDGDGYTNVEEYINGIGA
ncbi:MAG: polysaccharide lyase family 1 protein [Polyangiales bacterium]